MNRRMLCLSALVPLLFLACADSHTSPPTGGAIALTIRSAESRDAAIQFVLSGPRVDSITAPGLTLFATRLDPFHWRVVLLGAIQPGTMASAWVPDVSRSGEYSATVEQVAGASYEQSDPATYRVWIGPPERAR